MHSGGAHAQSLPPLAEMQGAHLPEDSSSWQGEVISRPGDQSFHQPAGPHMDSGVPGCLGGAHLFLPSTSCLCQAGSCFPGE
jgi:hypothetical protein